MQNGSTRVALLVRINRCPDWATAGFLSLACGLIYLAVRPPLYDNDGYRDRLQALGADWFWPNPHHLLWSYLEALVASLGARIGYSTTVSFQIVGIVVSCLTLMFFFLSVNKAADSRVFSAAAVVFVAFSPQFWLLTLQNREYALLFLAFVLYLLAWQTRDGNQPSRYRLIAAGVFVTVATLLHQAAIFLVAAGALMLIARDRQMRSRWLARGLVWGGSIAIMVFLLYVAAWESIVRGASGFFEWMTDYAWHIHGPDLFDLGFGLCLIKSVIAISGVIVQPDELETFLSSHFSPSWIYTIYGFMGAAVCGGVGLAVWKYRLGGPILKSLRTDACLALSTLSIVVWWAFMSAWEPNPQHYALLLFPGLLCLASSAKGRITQRAACAFVGTCIVFSIGNGYLNHQHDLVASRNFPPPLIAQIRGHVGNGIFIVLVKDGGIGGMDYDLLLTSLEQTPNNPAVAILDDFTWPAKGSPVWRDRLRAKIDATLDAGEPVFVADHVLNPDAYKDLSGLGDPYAHFVSKGELVAEAPSFYEEIRRIFGAYKLEPSNFKLGVERYFRVSASSRAKTARVIKPDTDAGTSSGWARSGRGEALDFSRYAECRRGPLNVRPATLAETGQCYPLPLWKHDAHGALLDRAEVALAVVFAAAGSGPGTADLDTVKWPTSMLQIGCAR